MFVEALVMAACIQGQGGCTESTAAYYKTNNELQQIVQGAEKIGQKITNNNKWLVYMATPVYAVASGKPASFTVSRGWIVGVDVKKELVLLQWSY